MRRIYTFPIAAAVLLTGTAQLVAQDSGYRLAGSEIVIDGLRHWQNWQFPVGTLELAQSGEVRPSFLRRNVNAVEDIVDFLRLHPPDGLDKDEEDIVLLDAIEAGSNARGVLNVLDGEMDTYWEPDPPESEIELGSQWWFTVDLGRLVIARRIVLKFVEEDMGDPFLQFDVLISDGEVPVRFSRSDQPEFYTVWRTLKPNKDERVLEISFERTQDTGARELSDEPLESTPTAAIVASQKEFPGTGVRFVQVVVRASDFARGRQVSEAEYGQLVPLERGDIVYHKLQRDGRLTEVGREDFDKLPADRQGDVVHYRKERPRLAELEVWSEGDDALIAALARGGAIDTSQERLAAGRTLDGNVKTFVSTRFSTSDASMTEGHLTFDMGSTYWIDAFRIAYGGLGSRNRFSFPTYRLDVSDGTLGADGSLKWTTVASRRQMSRHKDFEGHDFDLVKTRFFRMVWEQFLAAGGLAGGDNEAYPASVQLYGRGFQPEVWLESDLIRLRGRRNLLSVEWDAKTPPGTQVALQTRTGNETVEILHYFHADGREISKGTYDSPFTLEEDKGDIIAEEVEGDDWSGWSQPYKEVSGSPITSPSPRGFLKIRAAMLSDDPDIRAALRSIRLRFTNPVAQGLVGEVTPFRVDSLGVERTFSLYLKPQFEAGDQGFDEMLLVLPPDMSLEFSDLYAGTVDDFTDGGDLSHLAVEDVEARPTEEDSLRLAFPP